MPDMIYARTSSVDATRAVGGAFAGVVVAGDLLVLAGDLGAGKTAFVQGFGRALGVDEPITSPTFTLANRYAGRLEINHLDVYRLEQLDEIIDLGIYELIDGDAVTLIEWGDAIAPVLGADLCEIRFGFIDGGDDGDDGGDDDGDDDRDIEIRPAGPGWTGRSRALAEALDPWSVGDGPC